MNSPEEIAKASVLAREVGEEMLSRLDWMTLKPRVIVDLGCGTGEMSVHLQTRYAEANVIALDISETMVEHVRQKNLSSVCADAASLPLQNQSVDLLFVNLLFPWQKNPDALLRECRRVLAPEGLLIFSALGPDSFREWREVFQTPALIDMHDAGDFLMREKFADPVLDVNYYTMTYREQSQLFSELQITDMLIGTPDLALAKNIPASEEGRWEVTYEVIIAHAFVPSTNEVSADEDGVVRVPLSRLRRRLK